MGKRERYEPGTFSWADLSTSDSDGAKVFYGGLFGWEFEDSGVPGGVYTMCQVEGDSVAAIVQQNQHPAHWNNYVTVTSADGTAAKAQRLGAKVLERPFDVMESGRMAVLADPSGAMLCVWEPREHIGAGRVNDPGCMGWNELQTRDPQTATAFYPPLFGWKVEPVEQDGTTVYVTIKNQAGWMNGGVMPISERQGDTPPFWMIYFIVDSCDDAVARVKELGGEVLAGPMEPGAGRIAVVSDPQGAVFAVFEGETDE